MSDFKKLLTRNGFVYVTEELRDLVTFTTYRNNQTGAVAVVKKCRLSKIELCRYAERVFVEPSKLESEL
jgi:hypothetical protein